MRAAVLYGPEDLRVEEVPEPDGEVVVDVEAATTCGTDVKMWRYGHPVLPPYPCAFGHETAGVRTDTASACSCPTRSPADSARHARPGGRRSAATRLGARRLRRADRGAGRGAARDPRWPARRRGGDGRAARGGDPRDRARRRRRGRRRARRRPDGPDARLAAGGRGQIGDARRSPPRAPGAGRRARAPAPPSAGAPRARLRGGRPSRRLARGGRVRPLPGGVVVLVGGCPRGTEVALPAARSTTTSSTSVGRFTTPATRSTGAGGARRRRRSTGSAARARRSRSSSFRPRSRARSGGPGAQVGRRPARR